MILLQTERLTPRNYSMDDVPAVHEYFSNEEVSRYEDFWPQTMEDVAQGLSEWKDMDNRMAVILTETGELIGSVGYWVDEQAGNPEYSIDFDFNPRFWHKGYALEAAMEVVRHLTEDLGVKQILGDCDERNTASAKLLERLGFCLIDTVDDSYKEDEDGRPIMINCSRIQAQRLRFIRWKDGKNNMDKGIVMWALFIAVIVAGALISRRIKSGIREDGIETEAVVSRIVDNGTQTDFDVHVYVKYRTADGIETEGILSNPRTDLKVGQPVRIKYHPKLKANARLIE